jgi:hypothetical protein
VFEMTIANYKCPRVLTKYKSCMCRMIQSIDSSVLVQQEETQFVEGEQAFQLSCIHMGLKLEYLGHRENTNGVSSSYFMDKSATFSEDLTTAGMTTCVELNGSSVHESTSSSVFSQPYLIVAPPASSVFIEHASDILLTFYAAQYLYGGAQTVICVLKHKVLLPKNTRQYTLNFRMDDGLLVDGAGTSIDEISGTIDGFMFQRISMSSARCGGSCCSSPSQLAHLSKETSLLYPRVEWPYVSCGKDSGDPSRYAMHSKSNDISTYHSKYDGMVACLVLGAIIAATIMMKDAMSAFTNSRSTETEATSNLGESVTDMSSMVDVLDSEVSRQSPTEGFVRRSTTTPLGKGSRLLSASKEWQRDRAGRLNRSKT